METRSREIFDGARIVNPQLPATGPLPVPQLSGLAGLPPGPPSPDPGPVVTAPQPSIVIPPPKAKIGNLPLTMDERKNLAQELRVEKEASKQAQGDLPQRWKRSRDLYGVVKGTTSLQVVEGMQPYPLPILTPKVDKIRASTVSAICDAYPIVQCLVEDDQDPNAEALNETQLEQTLMNLSLEWGFQEALDRAWQEAILTNQGWLRVRPVPDRRNPQALRGVIDWGSPDDLMVFPSDWGSMEDAKSVGHRTFELVYRVKQKQKAGLYYDGEINGGASPRLDEEKSGGRNDLTEPTMPADVKDQSEEIWEIVTERDMNGDGNYSRYICTLALPDCTLLTCKPYGEPEYPEVWYVDVATNTEGKRVWRNSSVGQKAQGAVLAISDIHNLIIGGSMTTAAPPVLLTGGSPMVKAKQYGPGMIWEGDTGMTLQSVPITFNPGELPQEVEALEEMLDAVTGINRLGNGENLPATTKATAIDALMQAQNDAKDSYTDACAPSVQRVFELMLMLLRQHFDQFKAAYGAKIKYDSVDQIPKYVTIEVSGRNASASPDMMLKKLSGLKQIASDPLSDYDPRKVDDQIVQHLDLPFSTIGLKKDPQSQFLAAGAQMALQGIDPMQALQVGAQTISAQQAVQQQAQALQQHAQAEAIAIQAENLAIQQAAQQQNAQQPQLSPNASPLPEPGMAAPQVGLAGPAQQPPGGNGGGGLGIPMAPGQGGG